MAGHNDDLEQLLDSALDDFQNLNLTSSEKRKENHGENIVSENSRKDSTMQSSNIQGLGLGLPDLKSKKRGKQKVPPSMQESHVSEALDKLRNHTKEAIKELESMTGTMPRKDVDDISEDAMVNEWVKQFEEIAGSQDMQSIVETMMQQLLSKEILHEPMKEIAERYPAWLQKNKAKLTDAEYAQYCHQYELINDLNEVYEKDPNNFTKIVELMQKMQECGQPPNDLMQELAPDFDLSSLGQLSAEIQKESQQNNCCIM